MSSTKRKATTPPKDGSEASRAQRKRVQNRISQKCHRERQAAHARHLESLVGIIKTGDQEGDNATPSDRYTALLRQHMKALEEKRQLEEAIFRMRKKLLSISNSAAATAGDETIDALIHSKDRRTSQSEPVIPLPTGLANPIEPNNDGSPVSVETQCQDNPISLQEVTTGQPTTTVSPQKPQPLDLADSRELSTPSRGFLLPSITWNSDVEEPEALLSTLAAQLTPQDQSYAWGFGAWDQPWPLDYTCSTPPLAKTVTVTSPTVFYETIFNACKKYIDLRNSELDHNPTVSPDFAAYGGAKMTQETNYVAQIPAIGVHMLATFAGLECYIYSLGAASIMESVMRWRLQPTFANRNAIPELFRPTPLQFSTDDYPHHIDFINWPAIRDQLILHSRNINIDKITREMVRNTVVEIPHRRISVNVLSLFNKCTCNPSNHWAKNNNLETPFNDAQWKYLEFLAPSELEVGSAEAYSPAESALLQEISRRMDTGSNASWSEEMNSLRTIDTVSTPCVSPLSVVTDSLAGSWSREKERRNEIVTRFGLDQVTKWKLSKEFARKHTYLDCSSAMATFDMVSAQSALEADAMAC